jgi:hypothetical protein
MNQHATSRAVSTFLAALPVERRADVEEVRRIIRHYLPKGYEEVVSRNMLVYQVPLDRYPDTYNGHPLWYAALASEKSYLALHLMPIYGDAKLAQRLDEGFRAAGKKVNRGKSCIRFAKADDLALEVIGQIVEAIPLDRWVQIAESAKRGKRLANDRRS